MKKLYRAVTIVAAACAFAPVALSLGPEHGSTPAKAPEKTPPKRLDGTPTKPAAPAAKPAGHTEPAPAETPQAAAHAEDEAAAPAAQPAKAPAATAEPIDADKALALLTEGNQRWCSGKSAAPNTDSTRRESLADKGQTPFATIVTCSDSRVPVERVFDRGVGDLFVVRVAGNRGGGSETGTVEYGVEHLKTPVLMVMGHTKCGAVAAAAGHAQLHGKVAELVKGIEPAVERARRNNPGADEKTLAALAVKENVWQTIFDMYKTSDTIREAVQSGHLKVVGAVYDISTGKVEIMGEHPWQQELLQAMKAETGAATTASAEHENP